MVRFCEFKLLDDPVCLGSFDVVLCRNVLIYFDQATKARILAGLVFQSLETVREGTVVRDVIRELDLLPRVKLFTGFDS